MEISLSNLRGSLDGYLDDVLHGRSQSEYRRITSLHDLYDGSYDMFDDEYEYDDILYPPMKGSAEKKRPIWFYNDYQNEHDKLEFDSFLEFKAYCDSKGYKLPLGASITYDMCRNAMHACVDPFMLALVRSVICYAKTYGELYFEVCGEDDI